MNASGVRLTEQIRSQNLMNKCGRMLNRKMTATFEMEEVDTHELATRIKTQVNKIRNLKVKGEITKITKSNTGHTYFDMVSPGARVSCVAWASANVLPRTGMSNVSIRQIDYYAPYGKCQAIVSDVIADSSKGDVAQQRAKVIDALHQEKVISRDKLPIPFIVKHLCIITSHDSAAYFDMMEGIAQRWPGLKVTVVHSSVQGDLAIDHLKRAFAKAVSLDPDVIICGRGGGSEHDLEVFNSDEVVRLFHHPTIPIISAIGHESDHCICDMVADHRAKTPTASIELAIPRTKTFLHDELHTLQSRSLKGIAVCIDNARTKLKELSKRAQHEKTHVVRRLRERLSFLKDQCIQRRSNTVKLCFSRLEHLKSKLRNTMQHALHEHKAKLQLLESKVQHFSYKRNLEAGYAIVWLNDEVASSRKRLKSNDRVRIQFQDGDSDAVIL